MPDKPDKASEEKAAAVASTSNDLGTPHHGSPGGGGDGGGGSSGVGGSGHRHSGSHRRKHHHHHHHHHHHSGHHRNHVTGDVTVPLQHDEESFADRQRKMLSDMEKRMEEEVKKKKEDWEKEVERMKEEFLSLYPADKTWGSEDYLDDPLVFRRRGSTDVLDTKKMKTMFLEYPGFGRRFKLRYDVEGFIESSITVACEGDRIIVKAKKLEPGTGDTTTEKEYSRKIEKPLDVDPEKLKCHLTSDSVLIVEAPLPPKSLNIRKTSASPSHSSYSSSRSRSPSNSPHTPKANNTAASKEAPKVGIPHFAGAPEERKMTLLVDIGHTFKPREITVQVINNLRLQVKAKHEERTSERFSKSKFSKEFELPEKIEPFSLRAGLTEEGRLLVGALGKGVKTSNKNTSLRSLVKDIYGDTSETTSPCNVLDLASFPPTTPGQWSHGSPTPSLPTPLPVM